MKKSYHSNAVPADDAAITRAIDQSCCCGCSAVLAILSPLLTRDSSAAASVQLADHPIDAGELQAELTRVDVVGERASVRAELELLDDAEVAVLHHVADRRRVARDGDIDRPGRVAERTSVMVRSVGTHDPLARPHRFVSFVHRVDQHEVAAVALAADGVDNEPGRVVEDDLQHIFGMTVSVEESREVELRLWIRRRGCGCSERERGFCDELHCRPASSASTTLGSASV